VREEQSLQKPTYRALWIAEDCSLLDIWQGAETRIDPGTLHLLWMGSLVPKYVAQQALHEYNQCFGTSYTLEQVEIPTMEALGYGKRFHAIEGESSMAIGWTWEYYRS
jgi:hypothetical protein